MFVSSTVTFFGRKERRMDLFWEGLEMTKKKQYCGHFWKACVGISAGSAALQMKGFFDSLPLQLT